MSKSQKIFAVLAVVVLLAGSIYVSKHRVLEKTPLIDGTENQTSDVSKNNNLVPISEYGLFVQSETEKMNHYIPVTHYREAGTITSGDYAGYHRILGFVTEDGPGGAAGYFFATKDYKTFILDSSGYAEGDNSVSELLNSYNSIFNKEKVTGIAKLPTNFPYVIDEGNFVYVRGAAIDETPPSGDYNKLASSVQGLSLYYFGGDLRDPISNEVPSGPSYVSATTDIKAVDDSGILFNYSFVTKEMYARRLEKNDSWTGYQEFYVSSDLDIKEPHYIAYGQFAPGGCGAMGSSYVLQNVTDSDFTLAGKTIAGLNIYKPADQNSPLNQAEYYRKIGVFKDYSYFFDMNHISTAPSYESYVAKDPVLAFKDSWGRWIAIGELDYQIPGGCGKPVIYLYPTTPTNVSVTFKAPVFFDRAIPSYANGWNVKAYPDGTLKDLQASMTNCNAISYIMPGAEYARDACKKGEYPYIYWSGKTTGVYPKQNSGWIISRGELASFLDAKLKEIGFSEKEKSDMESYWVPAMLAKNAPYYRVAFIQTKEMNDFIPMKVTPTPDTVLRIFLDWQPLSEKPTTNLVPEKLEQFSRKGFALVEWGGLRQ